MKVIKIGAVWCSGCLLMRPRWQELEQENPWLETVYYDYDQDRDKIKKYNQSPNRLPVFIFLDQKGKVLENLSGEFSKKDLQELLDKYKNH
jgi:thiol-disulfide isomerase/thioredoxin